MWELMFNRNCSTSSCTDTSGQGNAIWIGESEEAVLERVGAAIGYALVTLPTYDVTYQEVRQQIVSRVSIESGGTVAGRVASVFSHHGFP
jgi:hypothetical protein